MSSAAADSEGALGLFQGYGIELEYMIVDAEDLAVRPLADRVILDEAGRPTDEIERGPVAWSNELALHVVELKTNGPASRLEGLADTFTRELASLDEQLAPLGARLMPTAMHPWMDPARELALWPHGSREIYAAFHRIFDCRGHGWANLQSVHLNLPFADDEEFGRLHAALRALLPLLPALAASSPFVEGEHRGSLDARLGFYAENARRVPSVTGQVVPEAVFTRVDYEALLQGIYADLAPLDPPGTLRHEWLNARGCIARFERMALELRVLDVQETPRADLAICAAVAAVARALCDPEPSHQRRLRALETGRLAALLRETARSAERTPVSDRAYLAALGLGPEARSAGELWRALIDRHLRPEAGAAEHLPVLELLLEEGCLARRLLARLGERPARQELHALYRELCDCLREGRLLGAP